MATDSFPSPWAKEIPATLIRRLGEAADGFRGKGKAYYVVSLTPDAHGNHEVLGPYAKKKDVPAKVAAQVKSGMRGWFGPIHTPGPSPASTSDIVITDLVLSTRGPGSTTGKVTIEGSKFDCLFYSISAIEKFAIPYYARMFGGDYVKRLHESVTADNFLLMGHLPGTEYQNPAPGAAAPMEEPCSPGIAVVIRSDPSTNGGDGVVVAPILPWSRNGSA
ncbi:MAG TPA: hypothetical protein VEQ60_30020 [Longimicrobium sp.]|nr:hypothetical protein [Longimicrobium sp.]